MGESGGIRGKRMVGLEHCQQTSKDGLDSLIQAIIYKASIYKLCMCVCVYI